MSRERYPTDLSDAEWSLLEPHLPVPKRRGRPRVHSPREILNAVFYVLKSGCQWRMLPREFPPWKTVFTEGLVVEAKVHSAKVPEQDGIKRLLEPARSRLGRLIHLWVDAGYRGWGK